MDLKLNKRLIYITSWNAKKGEIRSIHIADIGHEGSIYVLVLLVVLIAII